MKRILALAALLLSVCSVSFAEDEYNCFGIIAGKNVTKDGYVILAHNEDDGGDLMVNFYAGDKYLWQEIPGLEASDAFLNRHGVAIVSDNCPSREDAGELTDGGIFYNLRVQVAERARTAREAVHIIGELVEKYGYKGSGRTYLVADSEEGWAVSVVMGKHWVAQRVPDDKVFLIPNYYVIDKVDLADSENFAGCADLVEYAISRGWYNPAKDGEFSFRKAYAKPSTRKGARNCVRHKVAIDFVCGGYASENPDDHPFAVKPAKKLSAQDMMELLSKHIDAKLSPGSICCPTTVVSNVFQLRGNMPKEIGCVMWTALSHPCIEAYIPWYLGLRKAPRGWGRFTSAEDAMAAHLSDFKDIRRNYPNGNWWKYADRWENAKDNLSEVEKSRQRLIRPFQKLMFKEQKAFEKTMLRKYCDGVLVNDPDALADDILKHLENCYKQYDLLD